MKTILISFLATCILVCCDFQSDRKIKVKGLYDVKSMPYMPELSGDSLFWVVVKGGLEIVPYLIEKLDDGTETDITVPNFGGEYTVADISYTAISTIIRDLPTLEFVRNPEKPDPNDGYWSYWKFVRESEKNRGVFKMRVSEWYNENKDLLIWHKYTRKFRSGRDWKFDKNKHPLGGYYKLKE